MFNFIKVHLGETIIIILLVIFTSVFIYLLLGVKNNQTQKPIINPNPTPITSSFDQNYNNFNQLVPGRSTLSDVEKINGSAYKDSIVGNKTYLYYKTPSNDYENKILLINNVLFYSVEYVFGTNRGTYPNYVSMYGQPSIHLYNSDNSSFDWFIFLNRGVGLETGGSDILQIVRFVPQSQQDFMKNISPELNLVSKEVTGGVIEYLPKVTPGL